MISLSTFAWDQDREEIGGEWEIRKQRGEDRMGQVKGCLIHHYMEEQDPNPTTPQKSDFGTFQSLQESFCFTTSFAYVGVEFLFHTIDH